MKELWQAKTANSGIVLSAVAGYIETKSGIMVFFKGHDYKININDKGDAKSFVKALEEYLDNE